MHISSHWAPSCDHGFWETWARAEKTKYCKCWKIVCLQYLILASVDGAALVAGVPHCTYGTTLWVLEVFQANLARHAKPGRHTSSVPVGLGTATVCFVFPTSDGVCWNQRRGAHTLGPCSERTVWVVCPLLGVLTLRTHFTASTGSGTTSNPHCLERAETLREAKCVAATSQGTSNFISENGCPFIARLQPSGLEAVHTTVHRADTVCQTERHASFTSTDPFIFLPNLSC